VRLPILAAEISTVRMIRILSSLSLVAFLFIHLSQAYAQNGTVVGTVRDSEGKESLIGANVVADDGTGSTTDINGHYRLSLTPGKHTLTASFIGYTKHTTEVTVLAGKEVSVAIVLDPDSKQLDIVVVSASQYEKRIEEETVSMQVIGKALVSSTNNVNLGEVVNRTPGVQVQDSQVSIRGGSSYSYGVGSRVAILVDGMGFMSSDIGEGQMGMAPLENVEQVEVIKGAASVVYGSSALNGIVNMRTAWPTEDKPRTEITSFASLYSNPDDRAMRWWSDNDVRGQSGFTFSHRRREKRVDIVSGGAFYHHKNVLQDSDELRVRANVKTRVRHKTQPGSNWGIDYNVMYEQSGRFFLSRNLDDSTFVLAAGSGDRYLRWNLDPHFLWQYGKGNRHQLDLRWLYIHRFGSGTDPDAIMNNLMENYQFQKNWKDKWILTVGAPATIGLSSSNLYTGLRKTYSGAVYAQGEYKHRRLGIVGGVRYEILGVDEYVETGVPVFRAGINYGFVTGTFVRGSFGQSYRIPAVAERFITNQLFNMLRILPNPNLKPEKGWNAEIGLNQVFKVGKWKALVDFAFFWQQYQNMVEYRFVSAATDSALFVGDNLFIGLHPNNVENARIAGLELSINTMGNLGPITVAAMLGYTYTYPVSLDSSRSDFGTYMGDMFSNMFKIIEPDSSGKLPENASNILQFRNRHLFRGDLELGYKRLSVGTTCYFGSYPELLPSTFDIAIGVIANDFNAMKRYTALHRNGDMVWDARIGYKISDLCQLTFMCKNIGNLVYSVRPAKPEPLRSFTLQAKFTF